jgi:hypothetical protein
LAFVGRNIKSVLKPLEAVLSRLVLLKVIHPVFDFRPKFAKSSRLTKIIFMLMPIGNNFFLLDFY